MRYRPRTFGREKGPPPPWDKIGVTFNPWFCWSRILEFLVKSPKYLSFHFFKSSEFPLVHYFLIKRHTFLHFLRKYDFFLTFGPVLVPRTKKQKSKNFVCQGLQRFKVPKVHKNLGCWAPIVTLKHIFLFFLKFFLVFFER